MPKKGPTRAQYKHARPLTPPAEDPTDAVPRKWHMLQDSEPPHGPTPGMLEADFGDTITKVSNADLKDWIERTSARSPRFLFRAWHDLSGGYPGLNTPEAITPLAFSRNLAPTSIHDIDRLELAYLANGHWEGMEVCTPFSSWSQSLAVCMSMVVVGSLHGQANTGHISIIDTTRLPKHNTVLHTPELGFLSSDISGSSEEFLVYGVVEGQAHKAVKYDDLLTHGLGQVQGPVGNPYHELWAFYGGLKQVTFEQSIEAAKQVGSLYGDYFQLPMAVNMLMTRQQSQPGVERIAQALRSLPVSEDWRHDASIMQEGSCLTGGLTDAKQAIRVLRRLVESEYGGEKASQSGGSFDEAENVDGDAMDIDEIEERPYEDEWSDAGSTEGEPAGPAPVDRTENVAKKKTRDADRLPRMLKELQTDLKGWEPKPSASEKAILKSDRMPRMVRELYIGMKGYDMSHFGPTR